MKAADRELIVAPSEFALSAREIELVKSLAPVLEAQISTITDGYYAHLMETQYAPMFVPERTNRLKAARIAHWRMLLAADFKGLQSGYLNELGPGMLEDGYPRSILVLATNWLLVELTRWVERSTDIPKTLKAELRTSLTKFAFFDLALAQAAVEVAYVD